MSPRTGGSNKTLSWIKYLLSLGLSEQFKADRKYDKVHQDYASSAQELEKLIQGTMQEGFGKNHDGLAS